MPSLLQNNTLSNISAGVTQQYQEGRFDSQVSEMINCAPSITRGVLRRNPINKINVLSGLPVGLENHFVYSYDRGTGDEQYIVVMAGDGYIHVYNANTGVKEYTSGFIGYFVLNGVGNIARDSFKAITLGDHTFIVNTTKTTNMYNTTATSHGYSNMAFYWIKKTTSVVVNQKQTIDDTVDPNVALTGSLIRGYKYTLNGTTIEGTIESRPGYTAVNLNTARDIAYKMAVTNSSVNAARDSFALNANYTWTSFNWDDTNGKEASLGVWKSIDNADDLPAELPSVLNNFIVKVSGGTTGEFDDYYLRYNYDGRTWREVAQPGTKTTLDPYSMPYVLYRLADGSFKASFYQGLNSTGTGLDGVSKWSKREAGGGDPLHDPSFLGKTIDNIFFHKNRLGFITKDSVVLSSTGDYGNFFQSTMQDVLDDDPIDLAVASKDVTVLRHAVSTSGQLFLFSDDTQFVLDSVEGPLTPKSADITALSNYTYDNDAPAVTIGNKVYFMNKSGGYSQLYAYRVTDQGSKLTEADQMTIHLPSYISNTATSIVGHDVLGHVFINEQDKPKELVVLSFVTKANQELQNAFHRWRFAKDIASTHIINNELYIIFTDGTLSSMSLEIPGNIDNVSYLDVDDVPVEYDSSINFSEFFVRDADGKGTVRGRYQLRTMQYTIEENSKYKTTVYSLDQGVINPDIHYGPTWDDTGVWDDNLIWVDVDLVYARVYENDDKITLMANSKKVDIVFSSSTTEPSKGFELSTLNIEALMHQRSRRR